MTDCYNSWHVLAQRTSRCCRVDPSRRPVPQSCCSAHCREDEGPCHTPQAAMADRENTGSSRCPFPLWKSSNLLTSSGAHVPCSTSPLHHGDVAEQESHQTLAKLRVHNCRNLALHKQQPCNFSVASLDPVCWVGLLSIGTRQIGWI